MKRLTHLTILLSLIFTTVACSKAANSNSKETKDFTLLVNKWNKAHSTKDMAAFSELYDNSVLFYGKQKDKKDCIGTKLALLKKQADFYQQIYGEVQTERLNDSEIKCSFIKRVTVNQETKDYPSYLTFKKIDGNWKIITEGDLVTDRNLAKNKKVQTPQINQQDYNYEPTVSVIVGVIKAETFFGPPGYGENPKTDSKEHVYVLNLDKSINVISNTKDAEEDEFNSTKYDIQKIQLNPSEGIKLSKYKNKKVRLSGTFFGAHTGHHFTEVLLDVEKIDEVQF